MGTMARSPILTSSLFVVVLASACASPNTTLDLATNDRLYVDVPFQTRVPGDLQLFVAPLVDARTPADLPQAEDGCPILYGSDQVWERPVREMVDEVIARQVTDSGLFAVICEKATAETLVLVPALESFTTGAIERISGAQSFAEVALRLKVYGPVDDDGKRPVVLDRVYGERKITDPRPKPVSPYLLVGSALQGTVQKALNALDASNVGRSSVPVDAMLEAHDLGEYEPGDDR